MKKKSLIILAAAFVCVLTASILLGVKFYVPRAEAQSCVRFTVTACNTNGCACPGGYSPISTTQSGSSRPYVAARYMTLCMGS